MTPERAVLVLFGIGLALFGLRLFFQVSSDRRAARAARAWVAVQGTIIRAWVTTEEKPPNTQGRRYIHTPHVLYEYDTDRHIYQGERIDFGPEQRFRSRQREQTADADRALKRYTPGKPVTVYYNPEEPARSTLAPRIEPDLGTVRIVTGMIAVVAGVGLAALAILSW